MLDVLLLAEIAWCMELLRAGGAYRASLWTGGLMAATVAGVKAADWLTHVLAPPARPVLRWVEAQLSSAPGNIPVLAAMIPPEPAAGNALPEVEWIAYYVTRSLLFVSITAAVFLVFMAVGNVAEALWDRPPAAETRWERAVAAAMAAVSGVYIAALTALAAGQLAWLRPFSWTISAAANSHALHWIGWLTSRVI
ncbi:MAG: hypothetical protein K6T30_00780 [Alicyclobacillus sp.]|nr:hypothetical protein [Alicyclobacillus sp.]